jgi:hypothetical protein
VLGIGGWQLGIAALLLFGGACAWPSPERQLLLDFFHACQVYDTTVLARLATVSCHPSVDGVVQDFEIVSVRDAESGIGAPGRDVTINARVRPLGGVPAPQMLSVKLFEVKGRWMVAGVTPLPASQTSPAASSAPPK